MSATINRRLGRHLLPGLACGLAACGIARAQVCDGWVQSGSSGPGPRAGVAIAPYFGSSAIFGGQAPDGHYYNDVWVWSGAWSPLRSSPAPSPRAGHAWAYDWARSDLVLFGGQTESGLCGETWAYRDQYWVLQATGGPPAMRGHAMTLEPVAPHRTILFGGQTDNGFSDQTWSWDGGVWRLESGPAPSARSGHALAVDGLRGTVLLFGGQTAAGLSGETWTWTRAGGWLLRATTGPSPRRGHAMASYYSLHGVVLYGGMDASGLLSDTWLWDGVAWAPVTTDGSPPPQAGHVLADEDYQTALLFGGENAAHAAEAWQLTDGRLDASGEPNITVEHGPFCRPGATATLTVWATGTAPIEFRWRKDGVPLADGGRFSGSATATLSIAPPTYTDQGYYDVVITSPCGALTTRQAIFYLGPSACRQDINCDGVVNVQDFLVFLRAYAEADPGTDMNQDGAINVQDFLYFLSIFSNSC